MKDTNRES